MVGWFRDPFVRASVPARVLKGGTSIIGSCTVLVCFEYWLSWFCVRVGWGGCGKGRLVVVAGRDTLLGPEGSGSCWGLGAFLCVWLLVGFWFFWLVGPCWLLPVVGVVGVVPVVF